MQFFYKIVVLFLIVFNFRVPVFYNSAFVSIILSAFYYITKRSTVPFTYFFQRYSAVILIGTILLAFLASFIAFLHHTDLMPVRAMRIWVEFMMLVSVVFALPLLVEGKEANALNEIVIIICYAFAIQGLISLAGFLYPPLGNYLLQMKPEAIKAGVLAPGATLPAFRLYNLSGIVFVELTAAFGVAFIAFFWLMLKYNQPYVSGWKKYLIFAFIFLGNAFAGRTGFIGLVIGFSGWIIFSFTRIFTFIKQNMWYVVGFSLLIIITYNFVLTSKQRHLFSDELFPFAFEWYYNYRDYGKFEVSSAEATPYHYYYIYDETLLKGDGVDAFSGQNKKYPHSDAGYTNTLVYGGIPYLLCLIIYQFLYLITPVNITQRINSRDSQINLGFFILLFLYIFIVEIKAPAVGYMHLIEVMYLALGASYITQYYFNKEQEGLTG